MKPVLLIWDIDGTLMSSKGIGRRAMNNAFKGLYNIDDGFAKVEMSGRLDYQIVKDALRHHDISEYNISNFYKAYENELKKEISEDKSAQVISGIIDILEAKKYNVYHVLGTGNCEIGARLKLNHVGLDHYFSLGGFGDEDCDRWEIIKKAYIKAQENYGVYFDLEDVYVIGDTPYDIECAKILGFKSIAVATGSHSYNQLREYESDFLLEKLDLVNLECILNYK